MESASSFIHQPHPVQSPSSLHHLTHIKSIKGSKYFKTQKSHKVLLIAICHAVLLFVANTFVIWHRQPTNSNQTLPGQSQPRRSGLKINKRNNSEHSDNSHLPFHIS